MIVYKQGDILASGELAIAHGCNCRGGFGSGFAKSVATQYPQVKQGYLHRHNTRGWKLGEVQLINVGDGSGRILANCATQDRYGRPDQGPYVSYPAIREVVRELVKSFPQGFAMVKIGAGLAGGNWDIIEQIIEEESGSVEVRVYVVPKITINGVQ
jgi:O-acetyl-ADP-ribose deacetylase (regulator of RNase III)